MESVDEIYAAATKGDQTARQRAREFASASPNLNAADRERIFHQVEVLLGAFRGP
jgi:hypothetical protein